jgi:hypothetical protein
MVMLHCWCWVDCGQGWCDVNYEFIVKALVVKIVANGTNIHWQTLKRRREKTLVNLGIKGPHLHFSFEDRIMRSYIFIFCLANIRPEFTVVRLSSILCQYWVTTKRFLLWFLEHSFGQLLYLCLCWACRCQY